MAKILVVDDSDNMRTFVKTTIEGAGHQVIEAVDGMDGVEKAKENTDIRLVVSDFNMPKMDGIAMTKHLRQIEALSNIPVLMLTTEASQSLKDMGKEAGVLAWVTKPFQPERLVSVIAKILSR